MTTATPQGTAEPAYRYQLAQIDTLLAQLAQSAAHASSSDKQARHTFAALENGLRAIIANHDRATAGRRTWKHTAYAANVANMLAAAYDSQHTRDTLRLFAAALEITPEL